MFESRLNTLMTQLLIPRAVLFDLDGTLLDNTPIVAEAYYTGMIELGYEPKEREYIRTLLGKTAQNIGRELKLREEDLPKIEDHFWTFFGKYVKDENYYPNVYPGVKEVLEFFAQSSIPVGICTSNKANFAQELIKKVDLDNYISTYVGADDVKEKKPSPEPLLLGLERLGMKKESSKDKSLWFVGDSSPDIEAANSAGMLSIGIPDNDKIDSVKQQNPDYLFSSMADFHEFILKNKICELS